MRIDTRIFRAISVHQAIRLEQLNIFPVNLNEKSPFNIDISPALKKPAEKPVEITLTPEEEKEFDRHQFKSRLSIEITGSLSRLCRTS